jgi:hypothetical protein
MTAHDTVQKPTINVCLLQPPGYIHALALLEAAEYVTEKSILAGYQASLSKNRLLPSGLNIVFGAHIRPQESSAYPPNTVIFNTEQIPEKSVWINSQYKDCLDRHFVWDYSPFNLAGLGHERAQQINFYHVEKLRRIVRDQQPEYDLIFYGSMNDRRKKILENLRNRGLKILMVFGLYGPERDALLGKARAVLNLHFYESQIFQQIRAFYALSNGIPVISENFPAASAPGIYGEVIFTPGREPFEDFVQHLLAQHDRFEQAGREKTARFHASKDNTEFDQILEKTIAAVLGKQSPEPAAKPPVSARINLGCGQDYRQDYLNIDINPDANPDMVVDLSALTALPVSVPSAIYGTVTLAENQIDEIIAVNVLEQVQQLPQLMGNCLKLLKVGGRFTILVSYDLSLGAWQDPRRVRAFNENSWLYYTEWFWKLGWFNERFDCTETSLNLTDYGKSLVSRNVPQEEILRTARAIDSMRVVLTKRETTPEEKTMARAYRSSLINS